MSLVPTLLYLMAALMAGYALYYRGTAGITVVFLASLFFALESQGWFLSVFFDSAADWPARSIQEVLVFALRSGGSAANLSELLMTAFGRLFILLGVFYGLFFALRSRKKLGDFIRAVPLARLSCVLLWMACILLGLLVKGMAAQGAPGPVAPILAILGAFAACGAGFTQMMDLIRSRRGALPLPPV